MSATKEWSRKGSFMQKPVDGWLHPESHLTSGDGMYYPVKYIGSIPFERSMRDLDFEERTRVTHAAIAECCEAAGVKEPRDRSHADPVVRSCLVAPPTPRMLNVKFTVSTTGIALVVIETNEVIAEHIMPNISFATGGDADDFEFVGYVAKDRMGTRECHVFDCGHLAADIIATLGQAFELRFKSFLQESNGPLPVPQNAAPAPRVPPTYNGHALYDAASYPESDGNAAYDAIPEGREVITDNSQVYGDADTVGYSTDRSSTAINPMATQSLYGDDPTYDTANSVSGVGSEYNQAVYDEADSAGALPDYDDTTDDGNGAASLEMAPDVDEFPLHEEPWFFRGVNRQQAEQLLLGEGDFLVRESMTDMGQYILSTMQAGYPKHLLLVDPQGRVRTASQQFNSPSHLINYHLKSQTPIQSRGMTVQLGNPVPNSAFDYANQ
eukprot:m.164778 g.164778  ORF g.164778 m.164778 type:complete len:439 (-) comp12470_c0_seq1:158-1474(-)